MLVRSPMFKVSEKVHAARNRKFDEPERREITYARRTALRTQQEVFQQDSDKKNEDSNGSNGTAGHGWENMTHRDVDLGITGTTETAGRSQKKPLPGPRSILEMEVDGNWIKTQMWFPGGHSAGTAKIVRTDPSSTCS
ncbi:unnamed protein product [Bursaphelenchus xylophilus]|nr:unnamed protein product [Bursaphelenchus xylophilus]CAG9087769.1 unnamed protein product [Bursaphelenchus xylophilus]